MVNVVVVNVVVNVVVVNVVVVNVVVVNVVVNVVVGDAVGDAVGGQKHVVGSYAGRRGHGGAHRGQDMVMHIQLFQYNTLSITA